MTIKPYIIEFPLSDHVRAPGHSERPCDRLHEIVRALIAAVPAPSVKADATHPATLLTSWRVDYGTGTLYVSMAVPCVLDAETLMYALAREVERWLLPVPQEPNPEIAPEAAQRFDEVAQVIDPAVQGTTGEGPGQGIYAAAQAHDSEAAS